MLYLYEDKPKIDEIERLAESFYYWVEKEVEI
jgi:hypothetical protein